MNRPEAEGQTPSIARTLADKYTQKQLEAMWDSADNSGVYRGIAQGLFSEAMALQQNNNAANIEASASATEAARQATGSSPKRKRQRTSSPIDGSYFMGPTNKRAAIVTRMKR